MAARVLISLLALLAVVPAAVGFVSGPAGARLGAGLRLPWVQPAGPVAQQQQQQQQHRPSARLTPLRDLLGLGPAEIAITLVVALVLFGPETLKSLSKDVGKAAAELKEIPKTFKEGMDEGAEASQVAKMKAIAAAKRAKRDGDDGDDDAPAAAAETNKPFEG